jgi:predicted nuclease of predicted toxin-antitoxin system
MPPKFLVDQNLSPKIVKLLQRLGFEAKRLNEAGLSGEADEKIAEYAIKNSYEIVTLDPDFGQLYYFVYPNMSVVVVRPKVPTIQNVSNLLEGFLRKIDTNKLERSLVVLTEAGYRIIGPEEAK